MKGLTKDQTRPAIGLASARGGVVPVWVPL